VVFFCFGKDGNRLLSFTAHQKETADDVYQPYKNPKSKIKPKKQLITTHARAYLPTVPFFSVS
jgi:hypothetical protein